jgi:hypothetical protein
MAKHVLYNASITVNGVDLSDHVKSISYIEGLNGVDAAAMSETQDYQMPSTITITDVSVVYYLDLAASKVYATHHTLVANRTTFNIIVKVDAGANATTNPAFTLPVFVKAHPFVNGARGDAHTGTITYAAAGTQSVATS